MNKLALAICALSLTILTTFSSFAQKKDSGYDKGTFLINGGLSVGGFLYSSYYYDNVSFPALMVNAEWSVHPWVGVGPYVGFRGYDNGSTIAVGARGTFHYAQFIPSINTDKVDLYGTIHIGPTLTHRNWDKVNHPYYNDNNYTGFTFGPVAGARYFFGGGGFGAFGEVGWGPLGFLTIGLSGKF